MAPIACIMCIVAPTAQQYVVPVAQATIIVAPYFLRDRISGAVRAARERRRAADDVEHAYDTASGSGKRTRRRPDPRGRGSDGC